MKVRITEYLEIDLDQEKWCCQRCGHGLIGARENYKRGCLVAEKPFEEVHPALVEGKEYSFSPDPITHDIELDVDALKKRHGS